MTTEQARETKVVQTSGGHSFTMNTYITGSDKRAIAEIYLSAKDNDAEAGKPRAMFLAEDKSIELVVVELDGSKDNILERFLKLPSTDYDEIKDAVKDVIDGKKKQ